MTLREIAQGYRIAEANLREQEHRILLQPEGEESHRLNTVMGRSGHALDHPDETRLQHDTGLPPRRKAPVNGN